MPHDLLLRLLEHSTWATLTLIEACAALPDAQLDAPPLADSTWSIRKNLTHLVESEQGYLALLTVAATERAEPSVRFEALADAARASGEALLALAQQTEGPLSAEVCHTTDGYRVSPWVVMVQVLNHATEHRKQIANLMRALGLTPPRLDGWAYGGSVGALVPELG